MILSAFVSIPLVKMDWLAFGGRIVVGGTGAKMTLNAVDFVQAGYDFAKVT